jgi:hypothetical protein
MADVIINVKAHDGASGVFDRVAKRLKAMQAESRASGEMALQRTLGSPQGLAQAGLDALGVGLPAVVVDSVGRAFSSVTEKALELRKQLREGATDAREIAVEFSKSIPILGSFVSGWLNVRELITGEKAAIEAINAETKRSNELYTIQASLLQKQKQALIDIRNEITRTNRETAKVGADDATVKRLTLQQQIEDTQTQRTKDEGDKLKVFKQDDGKLDEFKKQRSALEDKINDLRARTNQYGPFSGGNANRLDAQQELDKVQQEYDLLDSQVKAAEKRREAGIQQIQNESGNLRSADARRFAKEQIELEKQIESERSAAMTQAMEESSKQSRAARIALLKAQGLEEAAAIAEIEDQLIEAKQSATEKARETLKRLGESDKSEFGRKLLAEVQAANAERDAAAAAQIEKVKASEREKAKVVDSGETPKPQDDAKRQAEILRDIVSPELRLSSRGSGAADLAREKNTLAQQQYQQQKRAADTLATIETLQRQVVAFFKIPQIVELLHGVQ